MKCKISIPEIVGFIISLYNQLSADKKIEKVEEHIKPTKMDESQMELNLNRINLWIDNCDKKASFLLAFVGVSLTIFFTSNITIKIKEQLVIPFFSYWKDGIGGICFLRFTIGVCLIVGLFCILCALLNLLYCLRARTDYSKFKQLGIESKSLMFYQHIASMHYSDFCKAQNNHYNDLRSQIYINACICTDKFKYYNKALTNILIAIPMLVVALVLLFFI